MFFNRVSKGRTKSTLGITALEEGGGGGGGGPGGPTWEKYVVTFEDFNAGDGDVIARQLAIGETVEDVIWNLVTPFTCPGESVLELKIRSPYGNPQTSPDLDVLNQAPGYYRQTLNPDLEVLGAARDLYISMDWNDVGPPSLTAGEVEVYFKISALGDVVASDIT